MSSSSRGVPLAVFPWVFAVVLVVTPALGLPQPRTQLTVSAASNMTPVLTDLESRYERKAGIDLIFNFGATKKLAQQILQGAPVDLFISADVSTVRDLAKQGLLLSDTVRIYARGRLVLWMPSNSVLRIKSLADLVQPKIERVAMADPERAPYGAGARQALIRVGVWEKLKDKIIYGDNVAQTLQYAQTKNVDVAIIPVALAIETKGKTVDVPQSLHDPIDQALAVVKGGAQVKEARAFAAFLLGGEGRRALKKYGYTIPDLPKKKSARQ